MYGVLLQRGVFKWLAVRRDLFRLKVSWGEEITDIIRAIIVVKELNMPHRHHWLKGYLAGVEHCRRKEKCDE